MISTTWMFLRTLALGCALALALVHGSAPESAAQAPAKLPDLPTLFDLGRLHLEVVGAQAVEEIGAGEGDKRAVIKPKEGYILLVVTLRGTIEAPCRIPVATSEFSAVWEDRKTRTVFGKTETTTSFSIYPSAALALGDNWTLTPPGHPAVITYYFPQKGTALFRTAFLMPEEAKGRFVIRYPSVVRAAAQQPAGQPPPAAGGGKPGEKGKK